MNTATENTVPVEETMSAGEAFIAALRALTPEERAALRLCAAVPLPAPTQAILQRPVPGPCLPRPAARPTPVQAENRFTVTRCD